MSREKFEGWFEQDAVSNGMLNTSDKGSAEVKLTDNDIANQQSDYHDQLNNVNVGLNGNGKVYLAKMRIESIQQRSKKNKSKKENKHSKTHSKNTSSRNVDLEESIDNINKTNVKPSLRKKNDRQKRDNNYSLSPGVNKK